MQSRTSAKNSSNISTGDVSEECGTNDNEPADDDFVEDDESSLTLAGSDALSSTEDISDSCVVANAFRAKVTIMSCSFSTLLSDVLTYFLFYR
jgi:hypothetical protein